MDFELFENSSYLNEDSMIEFKFIDRLKESELDDWSEVISLRKAARGLITANNNYNKWTKENKGNFITINNIETITGYVIGKIGSPNRYAITGYTYIEGHYFPKENIKAVVEFDGPLSDGGIIEVDVVMMDGTFDYKTLTGFEKTAPLYRAVTDADLEYTYQSSIEFDKINDARDVLIDLINK